MGITEIIEAIPSSGAVVGAVGTAVGIAVNAVIFNLGNIFIPFDSFRQRKIKKLLKLIDEKNVKKGLKSLAEEQLQIEYFSYTFNLQKSNIINIAFVKQALDLIKESDGLITIEDFRNARGMVIIKDNKLKTKNVILKYIPLIYVFYPFIVIFYLIIYDEVYSKILESILTLEVISLIVLYALVNIWNFNRVIKIYKTTEKIKEALAEKQSKLKPKKKPA